MIHSYQTEITLEQSIVDNLGEYQDITFQIEYDFEEYREEDHLISKEIIFGNVYHKNKNIIDYINKNWDILNDVVSEKIYQELRG